MYCGRADDAAEAGVRAVRSVSGWPIALAMPKSITFGTGRPSYSVDQDVRRLEVAVDDPLLVGVLDRLADRRRTAPAARATVSRRVVAVLGDRARPATSSMTKYGRPSSVAPASSTRAMFGWSIRARACRSASNRATTGLRVHARLDDLERHLAADRLGLLGHVDDAHPALAEQLEDPVYGPMVARSRRRTAAASASPSVAGGAGESRASRARMWGRRR